MMFWPLVGELALTLDQFLFSSDAAEELEQGIAKNNHELVFLYDKNLVDEIWKDSRPEPLNKPIRVHELKYAGVDMASKLSSLRNELAAAGSSAIVISMLDEIAWLLNLVMLYLGIYASSQPSVIYEVSWAYGLMVLRSLRDISTKRSLTKVHVVICI